MKLIVTCSKIQCFQILVSKCYDANQFVIQGNNDNEFIFPISLSTTVMVKVSNKKYGLQEFDKIFWDTLFKSTNWLSKTIFHTILEGNIVIISLHKKSYLVFDCKTSEMVPIYCLAIFGPFSLHQPISRNKLKLFNTLRKHLFYYRTKDEKRFLKFSSRMV